MDLSHGRAPLTEWDRMTQTLIAVAGTLGYAQFNAHQSWLTVLLQVSNVYWTYSATAATKMQSALNVFHDYIKNGKYPLAF